MNYIDKFKMTKKNVFVVGGLGLIGKECVRALLDASANVVVLDTASPKKDMKPAHYENFDVADLKSLEENISFLRTKYGQIDCWVNIAYPKTSDWGRKVEELNLDSWKQNVDMHLNSYCWSSKAVGLIMKKQGFGSIVNFGSIYGSVAPDFDIYSENSTSPMAYSAIKGGIASATRYLASYLGNYNVRINTLCPGGVYDKQDSEFIKRYEKKTPLSRMASPEDIASTLLFLASDASSYITGQTIMVDGGWTIV